MKIKKKNNKKKVNGGYLTFTTGDLDLNMKRFNQAMGTDGLGNPNSTHLVVGDTFPTSSTASSSDGASDAGSSASESGAMGESLNEDKDFEIKIQDNENIEEDNEELNPPIDLDYFPNNMGINLCSVKSEKWTEQDDGQLKKVEIEFDPATPEEIEAQGGLNNDFWDDEEKEELTEAHLDYYTQKAKMQGLENGTRGFNAAAASDEKLKFNRMVCQQEGYHSALKIIEDEMIRRGLISRKQNCDKQIKLELTDINPEAAKNLSSKLDKTLIWKQAIEFLLFALYSGNSSLADKIKDKILNDWNITVHELITIVERHMADEELAKEIRRICANTKIESLNEDKFYSHREEQYFELPPEIKLLDQKQVEDFITNLSPEELFQVGYVTPIYFYAELDNLFQLVKATELTGYTGLDYRDAIADQTVADHAERVANAQRQIDTYKDTIVSGKKLNKEGEKFSTPYRQVNKLALNPEKSNQHIDYEYELDDDGNVKLDSNKQPIVKLDANGEKVIKTKIDLSKILFYPRVGSKPSVVYYLDVKDGNGYQKVKRGDIIDTLYRIVQERAFARDNQLSGSDSRRVQKYGFKDLLDFHDQFPYLTFDNYLDALKKGIDPKDYLKMYPFSKRWTMDMFSEKVNKMLDQDAKTIEAVGLDAVDGANRHLDGMELKPQVRALYTNQIYYISGQNRTFGKKLAWSAESLDEEFLDMGSYSKQLTDVANKFYETLRKECEFGDPLVTVNKDSIIIGLPEEDADGDVEQGAIYLNSYFKSTFGNQYKLKIINKPAAPKNYKGRSLFAYDCQIQMMQTTKENLELQEAKRYVKRYYVRPQNIFCSNKEDILKALLRVNGENCSIYSLKDLPDHDDVQELKPSDIIYYYDDGILYDKNHVKVMDYDLNVKHEEDRKKFADVDTAPAASVDAAYDDRLTDADLKDKEAVANFKAINQRQMK